MDDVDVLEHARYRFAADRLPVSKRPVVVVEDRRGGPGLEETLDADSLLFVLGDDATLREAEHLAERLNDRVARVSAVEAGRD